MVKEDSKKKVILFVTLSVLGLLLLNITLIGGYILLREYGSIALNPGEIYRVNIPFIGPSRAPMICGKAEQTDGTALEGIRVIANYSNNTFAGEATTETDGTYCITLPEITTSKTYNIYLEYDNSTLTLASYDYTLSFENNKIYNKGSDEYVNIIGDITNEDARIENGKIDVSLQYYPINASERFYIFNDQEYYIENIEPNEIYFIPSSDFNLTWMINSDTLIGRYKFRVNADFNTVNHYKDIYFNITG